MTLVTVSLQFTVLEHSGAQLVAREFVGMDRHAPPTIGTVNASAPDVTTGLMRRGVDMYRPLLVYASIDDKQQ